MFVRFPQKSHLDFQTGFFLYIRFINQYCVMAKYSRIFDGMTIRFGVSVGRPSNCNPCLAAIFRSKHVEIVCYNHSFFILSGIKGFENLIFSSVLVDLSSIIMRSSAILISLIHFSLLMLLKYLPFSFPSRYNRDCFIM